MADIQQLIEQLQGDDAEARLSAAEQLAGLGEDARAAAVPLVTSLERKDESLENWLVAALEQLGPPDATDLASLVSLLRSDNSQVGYWASTLLGRLGERAAGAAPQMARTLDTSIHPAVQQRAAWALGKLRCRDPQIVESLQRAARASDVRLARLAREALGACGLE
jgi:HEAT repeat protein